MVLGDGPVLEVGAGEGLTLAFRPELMARGYVGVDLSVARAQSVPPIRCTRGTSPPM
jgi:hypothetical protein